MRDGSLTPPKVHILHETNPAKYFPAVFALDANGDLTLEGAHRYSVAKEWLRAAIKDRTPFGTRTRNAASDLWFRLTKAGLKDRVIVMGFAPWDWRILIYRGLARRNQVIYHTSWHDWGLDRTPRQPRPEILRRWLSRVWLRFVQHPNVRVVAVTPVVAAGLKTAGGVTATVIPHAVPKVFFDAGKARAAVTPDPVTPDPDAPLKLLFVGEVSKKKGVGFLQRLMPNLSKQGVTLTVVGDGSLGGELRNAPPPGVTFHGPERDRAKLAGIMGAHDVLVVPSLRTKTWEELFGIVIIEALAAGMAVLASDHIGPSGILEPADGAGLLPEADLDRWKAEILAIAKDRSRVEDLRHWQASLADPYAVEEVSLAWGRQINSASISSAADKTGSAGSAGVELAPDGAGGGDRP